MRTNYRRQPRSGNVLVFTAIMMVVMFALLAFAVDLGYLHVARGQLQKSADAAALAAAWELIDKNPGAEDPTPEQRVIDARLKAGEYAALNTVAGAAPSLSTDDVTIGYLANPSDPNAQIITDPAYASRFNAVRVLARRTDDQNGEIATFFSRVIGTTSASMRTQATAAFLNNIGGFQTPSTGENLGILPFAFDKPSWEELMAGTGTDDFTATWDPDAGEWVVTNGPDGVLETNLYPMQTTGSRGNRGTVDIGNPNNAVPDIRRQILDGISPEDLEWHGGKLEFDANGELFLNGDTGLSAGMKRELEQIVGQPRVIPLFREMSGNGNNAYYTIVGFAGIRIVDVNLSGSMRNKRVMVQPAAVGAKGAIPAAGDDQMSSGVYSGLWLVR